MPRDMLVVTVRNRIEVRDTVKHLAMTGHSLPLSSLRISPSRDMRGVRVEKSPDGALRG